MTRMTGLDCAVMCNLINAHTYIQDPAAIATGESQAERRAGITAVGEQEQQPNVTSEPLDTQDQIPEMENLSEEVTVKAVIKKVNPQSAAGPSGLRYSHLQAALCDELVEDFAAFRRLFFPAVFCRKYSGHYTRALTFPRWGKWRHQWRAVISCGELLVPFSAADTAGSWPTTSSPGASTAWRFQAE